MINMQESSIIYNIIYLFTGFIFALLTEEYRYWKRDKKEEKTRKIRSYRSLRSWLQQFQFRWDMVTRVLSGKAVANINNLLQEAKWFADRISEVLAMYDYEIDDEIIYSETIDLIYALWNAQSVVNTSSELIEKAQGIIEEIDKVIEKIS